MAIAYCPEREQNIVLEVEPVAGQRVRCLNCRMLLEVINLEPLELDWVYLDPVGLEETWDRDRQADKDWEEEFIAEWSTTTVHTYASDRPGSASEELSDSTRERDPGEGAQR